MARRTLKQAYQEAPETGLQSFVFGSDSSSGFFTSWAQRMSLEQKSLSLSLKSIRHSLLHLMAGPYAITTTQMN